MKSPVVSILVDRDQYAVCVQYVLPPKPLFHPSVVIPSAVCAREAGVEEGVTQHLDVAETALGLAALDHHLQVDLDHLEAGMLNGN